MHQKKTFLLHIFSQNVDLLVINDNDKWLILYTFFFEYPTSKAADKSGNVYQTQNPHIWQNQILIDFRTDKALPSCGLEQVLKYSVFNFFLNKVTDGALRILYGSLFQTVGAI